MRGSARKRRRWVGIGAALIIMVAGNGAYMESCAEYPPAPPAVTDTTPCSGDACAAGVRKKKLDLKNIYHSYFNQLGVQFEFWGAATWTDWGYTLGPNIIRWRNTTSDSWVVSPVGDVDITDAHWAYSACGRTSLNDTCVTRREWTAKAVAAINLGLTTLHINQYQTACVATRIYAAVPFGSSNNHLRNAAEKRCDTGPAALSTAARISGGRVTPAEPRIGVGPTPRLRKLARSGLGPQKVKSRPVGLQDLVSRTSQQALTATCWSAPNAIKSDRCEQLTLSLYKSLTPEQKRLVADTKVTACAGLSPRSWQRIKPESSCAKGVNQ